jgi:GTPase
MFIDEATITVKAGDGGDGCWAFERSRGTPWGTPSGGTGGRGGNVFLQGSSQLHTLQDASFRRFYRAKRGVHGKGSNWTGSDGESVVALVPLGTIITDAASGAVLCDCVKDGEQFLAAKGGRGGRGTYTLAGRHNPHPAYVEPGGKGEERILKLTLKVLADVGLVGRPNAGKSTFLSRISKARPKIADYPFTTTRPHLGIVAFPDSYDSLVVADIPGLIEDSHKGRGLGVRFLRHIERTTILAILVESISPDPRADAKVLMAELAAYSSVLAEKPVCFILTKTDLCETMPRLPKGWLGMSAVSGDGVDKVLARLRSMHAKAREPDGA